MNFMKGVDDRQDWLIINDFLLEWIHEKEVMNYKEWKVYFCDIYSRCLVLFNISPKIQERL